MMAADDPKPPVVVQHTVTTPTPKQAENRISSRNIPEPMKREIRQRCGFGCVVCGLILYDYDHMLRGWAEVREHIADDITLLCTMHHREKTNGLLSIEQVVRANQNPYNLNQGLSKPYNLNWEGGTGNVVLANNLFTNSIVFKNVKDHPLPYFIPILIDGIPIVGCKFEDRNLLLNLIVFNQFNECIMRIVDSQMVYKTDIWDVTLIGAVLTIRERKGKILLELEFCPPSKIVIKQANLYCNGVELQVRNDHFVLNGKKSGVFSHNAVRSTVGISIGDTGGFPQGVFHNQQVLRWRSVAT